ncbi:metallophosphoesterase [Nocardia sp. 004]|uniref:metallophosphoesterase n=1 Tax=Nocardia sp. 004 TaxID=3385978 RepID=UPI0039A14E23
MSDNYTVGRREFLAGAATLAAGATLLGRTPAQAVPVAEGVTKFPLPDDRRLRVLVTGDAGTGTRTQWAVADAMRTLHGREPFSLALGLGDNLYDHGPENVDDPQFAEKFEQPNAGLDFPWLMVLGNHDNSSVLPGDGGCLRRGNTEVEYHADSQRWWMPSRYYSVRIPEHNPVVEFFVLDLNPLAAYLPPVFLPYWAVDGPFMNEQRAWLDRALAESTATWKIACTHHPYLSNGPHGNAGSYDGLPLEWANGVHVKRFMEDHVVGRCQFILSGHDHTLQVLEPSAASVGTRQIVCGAAAKTVGAKPQGSGSSSGSSGSSSGSGTRTDNAALYENYHELGFMVLELTSDRADVGVHTVDPATGASVEAFQRRLA